ncbi:MAG TPA: DUF58 domain-containing protein [Ktedonobacterales bacterium]
MQSRNTPNASTSSASLDLRARRVLGRASRGRLLLQASARRTRRYARLEADPRLTRRRPLYLIAMALIVFGIFTQYALISIGGALLLGIAAAPELWYRYGLAELVVTRESSTTRAALGTVVTVPLTVENRKLLPLPLVETEDELPEALPALATPLHVSSRTGSARLTRAVRLWAFQRVRRRYYLRAIQRGAYEMGPTLVRVSDPFGILSREQEFDTTRALLVHPLIAPLERFGVSPQALFGDHASRRRLLEDPLRVAGVREYAPGDDPRRVHWKATARLGTLQSKLLDPSTQRTLLIALDVRTFNQAQLGYDPDLAELGIAAAASVAAWAIERGFAVGIVANGAFSTISAEGGIHADAERNAMLSRSLPRLRLEPSSRPEQLTLILDGLARVILFGGGVMSQLISDELRRAPAGASLVYVGLESLVDVPTLIALRRAQTSGHAVSLILTKREADDPFAEAGEAHDLHATGLSTYYVGGRRRWQALLAETLGDPPARSATDTPDVRQLAAERKLIAQARQERARRPARGQNGAGDAQSADAHD